MTRRQLLTVGLAGIIVVGVYFVIHSHDLGSRSLPISGSLAPDFTLLQLTGEPLTLSAYRNKVVLLDFWATWCDPCRDEIPQFVSLQSKYGNRDFQVIGVSMDDGPEPVREFYQRFNMNYPVVMGNARIGELYGGILGLPIAFVIGRDGRIYSRHIGATGSAIFEKEILDLLPDKS